MLIQTIQKLEAAHLDVMNILNEIVTRYPSAISFAPGRPAEQFCDIEKTEDALRNYIAYRADTFDLTDTQVRRQTGQYQKTNGSINDLICHFLAQDENIHVSPEAVMVTNGAQEGMAILASGLFDQKQDVLLVAEPTYNGMTGICSILGIEMRLIETNDEGLDLDKLLALIQDVRDQGKNPRALYLIPDFSNPLGTSMPSHIRHRLLDLAYEHHFLLIEDNPYGMLAYDDAPLPTLKSLDQMGVVIYLGTFSKILFPGLRIGFLVADQLIETEKTPYLAQELSKVKSLISVNTSPLNQAIVGGILLEHHCSLRKSLESKIAFYRANRDCMLNNLEHVFGKDPLLSGSVTWNHPRGGFFLTMTLPFSFTTEQLQTCAEEYGVICCPMSFFSLGSGHEKQIRLAFSAISEVEIEQGIERLGRFTRQQMNRALEQDKNQQ